MCDLLCDAGFSAVAAGFAPHDQLDFGSECLTHGERLWLAFAPFAPHSAIMRDETPTDKLAVALLGPGATLDVRQIALAGRRTAQSEPV